MVGADGEGEGGQGGNGRKNGNILRERNLIAGEEVLPM